MTELDSTQRTLAYADGQQTMTLRRTYPTSVDDLWDACTNAERIPRWFLPIRGDLEVGGRYELDGNASGTIESCDPPRHFRATWEFGGEVSWVEVTVAETPGGAELTLVHIGPTDSEHWEQYGPGAVGIGWDGLMHGLGLHVSTGEPIDPAFAAEWPASDEGRAFTRGSGDRWRTADLAAGTAQALADRRAAATIEAFLGE